MMPFKISRNSYVRRPSDCTKAKAILIVDVISSRPSVYWPNLMRIFLYLTKRGSEQ